MINRHSVDEKKGHVMSPPPWMGRASLISMHQLSRAQGSILFDILLLCHLNFIYSKLNITEIILVLSNKLESVSLNTGKFDNEVYEHSFSMKVILGVQDFKEVF